MSEAREVLLGPVQAFGATEQVARRIGEAIGSGILKPGEKLPRESVLAEQLEVAPMTLRQALAALREAGYITTIRGRLGGSFVAERPLEASPLWGQDERPTARRIREITDWRRAISGEAGALAALRADKHVVNRLRGLYAQCGACAGDAHDYRLADSGLHVAIAEAAGAPRLIAAEAQIQVELAELLRSIPRPKSALEASNAQHKPIVDAIAAGDADAARHATIEHVESTYTWFIGLSLGKLQ